MFPEMKQSLLELVIQRDGLFGVVVGVKGDYFFQKLFHKKLKNPNPLSLLIVHEQWPML